MSSLLDTSAMVQEVRSLVRLLADERLLANLGVIPWAAPVVSFGNPAASRVATLGLNPSNLEFVDSAGRKLMVPNNRLESLITLNATNWAEVAARGLGRVWRACEEYFYRNPYDQWFKRLDRVLAGTGTSYYSRHGPKACHLDLVPFATERKWSALSAWQRGRLVELGAPSLVRTLRASDVRVLVLNGSAVVKEVNRLLGSEPLKSQVMPDWALQGGRVQGVAHWGRISSLKGMPLRREVLVLGYNFNVQSSFGVTNEVVSRVAKWITQEAAAIVDETKRSGTLQ